ncbi:MAG: porin family protein [Cytophagales bacterium]|nr:porin family protein [Cytophagales bacterium]
MRFLAAFLVLCVVLPLQVAAQTRKSNLFRSKEYGGNVDRSLKITIGGGVSSYNGDLNSVGERINTIFSGGIMYKFAPHVSLRGEFSFYRLSGTDAGGRNSFRNLSFQSRNIEAYGGIMYELFDVENPMRGQGLIINPYVWGGLGFTTFSPYTTLDNTTYFLRRYRTEDVAYSGAAAVIPLGAGIRFEVSRRIGFSLEGTYRFTLTDYLDDVSTTYIGSGNVTDNIRARLADRGPEVGQPFREAGSQRGNPNRKDGYATLMLRFEYLLWPFDRFGKPQCPPSLKLTRKPVFKR